MYFAKIIMNLEITRILLFLPLIIPFLVLTAWLFLKLTSEKSISEIVALMTGVSNITSVVLGIFLLNESFGILKGIGILLVILGTIILKFKKSV